MAQVGMLIEPVDQTTKQLVDNEQKTTEAVMLGSALGGLVVPKVHGSVVNLDTFEINLPKKIWESEDSPDARYMLSEYLFRYGDYGFTVMGSKAEDVLEETESLVVSDVTKQRMFRIGCGIVVHASLETHIRHNEKKAEEDRRRLAEQLDQPDAIDWSSDIYDLLRMKDDQLLENGELIRYNERKALFFMAKNMSRQQRKCNQEEQRNQLKWQ